MSQNSVRLTNFAGSDLMHATAAWASTGGVTPEKIGRVGELLKRLASEGHGTPFEHSMLTFEVTSEIATHIQVLKHRAGVSVNSASARYRELNDDRIYIPEDWPQHTKEFYEETAKKMLALYHTIVKDLEMSGVSRKRAKESARFIRPYGAQIDYVVTFNFRSFIHFVGLRATEHAQKEIRELAAVMVRLVRETGQFNASLEAFGL